MADAIIDTHSDTAGDDGDDALLATPFVQQLVKQLRAQDTSLAVVSSPRVLPCGEGIDIAYDGPLRTRSGGIGCTGRPDDPLGVEEHS